MSGDQRPAEKAAQWQFLRQSTAWTWRRLRADGTLDSTAGSEFRDYAFAVNDAINHGFRPRRDYWVIVTELGSTHFRSGQMPAFVARDDNEPFPSSAKPKAETQKPGKFTSPKSGVEQ